MAEVGRDSALLFAVAGRDDFEVAGLLLLGSSPSGGGASMSTGWSSDIVGRCQGILAAGAELTNKRRMND